MNANQKRTALRDMLARRDLEAVRKWTRTERSPLRRLLSLTFDAEELIRWRAVEAVGKVAGDLSKVDIEKIRDTIRRLFWLMSDESGGLGWHSPEIIGEILVNVPSLIPEFAHLFPVYFKEEPFERGSHFAIARVASANPAPLIDHSGVLRRSLNDPDPYIRSCAIRALTAIRANTYLDAIRQLEKDSAPVNWYDFNSGRFEKTTVAQIAGLAVAAFDSPERAA